MSISISVRISDFADQPGKYKQVSIFAGVDKDHRALCGTITMLEEEAEDLKRRIEAGEVIPSMPKHGQSPWDSPDKVPSTLYTGDTTDVAAMTKHACHVTNRLRDNDGTIWERHPDDFWYQRLPDEEWSDEGVEYDILYVTHGPLTAISTDEEENQE